MKKLIVLVASMLFVLITPNANATGVTPPTVPKNLHVYSTSGGTYVEATAHNCSRQTYYLSPDHKSYNQIFAILLSAQMANKKVQIKFDKCVNGSNPQGNIVGVYLKD